MLAKAIHKRLRQDLLRELITTTKQDTAETGKSDSYG